MDLILPSGLTLLSSTADPTPYPAWDSGTAYVAEDYVSVSNFVAHIRYRAVVANTSKDPESTSGYWTLPKAVQPWDNKTKWLKGTLVYLTAGASGHHEYKARSDNVNKSPDTNPTYWTDVGEIDLWGDGTPYLKDDQVVVLRALADREYIAVASTTNQFPPDYPAVWFERGVANPFKILDNAILSKTTGETTLTTSVRVEGPAHALVLLGLENVVSVDVSVEFAGEPVYSQTHPVASTGETSSWTEYFFSEVDVSDAFYLQIPGWYYDAILSITLNGDTDDQIAVGQIVVGELTYLGDTQYGVNFGIKDYSRKEANDWGEITLVQRSYAKTMQVTLEIAKERMNAVYQKLTDARALPCVYNANNYGGTDTSYVLYGFYTDFSTVVQDYENVTCSIDIEGLT